MTEEFLILQQLDPTKRKETYANVMANLYSWFLMLVLLSFVLVCIGLHLLNQPKVPSDGRRTRRRLRAGWRTRFRWRIGFRWRAGWRTLLEVKWSFFYTASAVGTFLICYDLHLFLVRQFFSNCIQVEKTVCDTSNIIMDAHDLLTTDKVACFMETSLTTKLAAKAPKNNIIRRVLEEKTYLKNGERCIYRRMDYGSSLIGKFTISSRGAAMGIITVFNEFKMNSVVWLNSKSVYNMNLYFYLAKSTPHVQRLKDM